MSQVLVSLIVGSHFRPPAKLVLANLSAGCQLRLEPEPENPYDPNALRVFCKGEDIVASPQLEADLEASGFLLSELMEPGSEVWLGFVAASGGKPLKGTSFVGNCEFLAAGLEGSCQLGFAADGKATCRLMPEPQP